MRPNQWGLIDAQHRSDLLGRAHHRGRASDDAGRAIIRLEPGAAARPWTLRQEVAAAGMGLRRLSAFEPDAASLFLLMTQPVAPWDCI